MAKYTLVVGFMFSYVATLIFMQYGTGFKVMTFVLYLYGFVCLLGGIIGYRWAFLEHASDCDRPRLWHVCGLHRLEEVFEEETWEVELEERCFEARTVAIHENLVSVEKVEEGVMMSYPRKLLVSLKRC